MRKWLARLPHPFTEADRRAGYRCDISILQAEFSLTEVLGRPLAGLRSAVFITRAYDRLLRTGLAELNDPEAPTSLRLYEAQDGDGPARRSHLAA